MKIKHTGLFVMFIIISSFSQPQFGLDLSVGSNVPTCLVGANIRFSHFYEVKPLLSIEIEDETTFILILNNNFYLKDINKLQHYIGFSVGYVDYNNGEEYLLSGQYGLKYYLNEAFGLYGELGILTTMEGFFTISRLGITLYISSKK